LCPVPTAKGFIRALLNPDPARRLTAEQALAHSWLTSFDAPAEHDLSGLRENFDPRARWRNAIDATRVLSRFKSPSKSRQKISDDDDDEDEDGATSWRATLGSTTKQQQPPPTQNDHVPQPKLAGLVAKKATAGSPSSPPPLSFSGAISKAKAEKAPGAPRETPVAPAEAARKTPPSMDGNRDANAASEEDEMVLHMPGSFYFDRRSGAGAGGVTPPVGTVDHYDVIGMLGNLWRRLQL